MGRAEGASFFPARMRRRASPFVGDELPVDSFAPSLVSRSDGHERKVFKVHACS